MKRKPVNKTVAMLNAAFNADPNAIYTLVRNRIPCNSELANTKHVMTHQVHVTKRNRKQIGVLGLINAVLSANGMPLVAASFDPVVGSPTEFQLVEFVEHIPEKPVAKKKTKRR